jgi:hypothetical protein
MKHSFQDCDKSKEENNLLVFFFQMNLNALDEAKNKQELLLIVGPIPSYQ